MPRPSAVGTGPSRDAPAWSLSLRSLGTYCTTIPPATPDHEGPRRAVPQATEQHREEQVAVGAAPAVRVASERDVEVVAQPPRQRHVPPAPELLQRARGVGPVEVAGELGSPAAAPRRSRCRCSPRSRRRSARRRRRSRAASARRRTARGREQRVDEFGGEVVGDDLLEPGRRTDQPQCPPTGTPRGIRAGRQLGEELVGSDDRPGDQLGKKAR
jgi:hypothetical protein